MLELANRLRLGLRNCVNSSIWLNHNANSFVKQVDHHNHKPNRLEPDPDPDPNPMFECQFRFDR